MDKGADISDCGKYRYRLWRWWDFERPLLGFIMLNPSTANADEDDPTIRKCCGFARQLDQQAGLSFGGIMVTNLFGFRATNPNELKKADDPIGPDNDVFVTEEAKACAITICAWGAKGHLLGRDEAVLRLLRKAEPKPNLRHLGLTREGLPRHPLYLPYTSKPERFHTMTRMGRPSKLTADQIIKIRRRAAEGEEQKKLAAEYRVVPQTISDIVLWKTHRVVG